jgi:cysteinyl-tRNA synthetase
VSRTRIPDSVLAAAHARSRARAARQWSEADRLRAEIEAAGWTVVDRGTDFALSPTYPPDVEDGGRVRYGSAASVPSRLAEPPVGPASVVLVAPAGEGSAAATRTLRAVLDGAPTGTQVVVVADEGSLDEVAEVQDMAGSADASSKAAGLDGADAAGSDVTRPGVAVEVVATSAPFGAADARNAGIRRATAPVVILIDRSVVAKGDLVTPLVDALADPSVGVAGPWGLAGTDLRRLAPTGPGDVTAIDGSCLAFRRDDYRQHGPLDARFRLDAYLDVWWSLVLRDGGAEGSHRRALAVANVPIMRAPASEGAGPADRERQAKRNFYRLIERFGGQRDLLTGE